MKVFHLILAAGMLVTGSINTLTTKAADQTMSMNRYGYATQFNHPFFQAVGMFLGEMLCLAAFYLLRWRASAKGQKVESGKKFSPFIFLLPAMCDMTATSTMYLGLGLTDASIFQMLRGSVVIFTSIFSVVFLKRKLRAYHWIGIVLVIGGTAIVGAQGSVCPSAPDNSCPAGAENNNATVGNILIIVAQLIVAVQMVLEEKFIAGYDVPALQVVGFEGVFGFLILSCVLVIMYFIKKPAFLCDDCCNIAGEWVCKHPELCTHFEDTYDAFVQMGHSAGVTLALLGNVLSIAFFNYFGVSVTKHINAATRMVLDSLRTMVIWAFSLGVKWETFCWVQIIGFVVLLSGTIIYNAIVKLPGLDYSEQKPVDEASAALLHDADTHPVDVVGGSSINVAAGHEYDDEDTEHDQRLIPYNKLLSTPTLGRATTMKGR